MADLYSFTVCGANTPTQPYSPNAKPYTHSNSMEVMETSKKHSAQRQIEVAIRLFHEGKLDCAITLAAAGENILPATDDPHLFQQLQPHNEELDINLVINWLKHPFPPATATIVEFEAVIVIARGITKFVAVFHQTCAAFDDFLRWAHEAGHLPRLFKD